MLARRVAVNAISRALCPSTDARLLPKAIGLPLTSAGLLSLPGRQHGIRLPRRRNAIHTGITPKDQTAEQTPFPEGTAPLGRSMQSLIARKTTSQENTDPIAPQQSDPTWPLEQPRMVPAARYIWSPQNERPPTITELRKSQCNSRFVGPHSPSPSQVTDTPGEAAGPQEKTSRGTIIGSMSASEVESLEDNIPGRATGSQNVMPEPVAALCDSPEELPPKVHHVRTPVIYEALRALRGMQSQARKIRRLVKYLVEERRERPNVFLYEALVTANWDTTTGSAAELADITKEMLSAGIEPSQGFYHSALRLLAVHPDYLARNTILRKMKEKGMELKDEGKYSVALGLLRDGQTEVALEYWDEMCQTGVEIPGWVFDIFIYVLVMRGFLDDAFQLFLHRLSMTKGNRTAVSLCIWYYLLDECSSGFHHRATRFIWKKMVQPGILNPSDGIALNALNTASRHGDPALATAVIQLLSARKVKLGLHHYESLLESYAETGDLENPFLVLCIMADAGVQPEQGSTRSIFSMLKDAPGRADEAVDVLIQLSKDHTLPEAAVHVLLEVLTETADTSKTLDVYRRICDQCRWVPSQQTFVLLLDACRNAEPAVFLVSEMDRFSVRPSAAILDNLIRCFAVDGNLDVALLYLSEMDRLTDSTNWASARTLDTLLRRCRKEKHPRTDSIYLQACARNIIKTRLRDR